MSEKETFGEWSESINTFWYGANDCEWIAWKGSHQIMVYPCGNHPNPPTAMIQHSKRIETLEDFTDAMNDGVYYKAEYTKGKAYWQDLKEEVSK